MSSKENLAKPVSLRLSPKVRDSVKELSESTGLLQANLYDLILRAGCEAIRKNDMTFQLPLKFELKNTPYK